MTEPHPLFPVQMHANWQLPETLSLAENTQHWLLDQGSLTARLKSCCENFTVQVLGQKIQACDPLEANNDILAGEQVLVREVLLFCDGVPQVFARSLLPLSTLTGEQQELAHLGTQSLGQVLFNHPSLSRKRIEVAKFEISSTVHNIVESLQLDVQQPMWGRRSVFVLDDKPLMVAEVFLPGAYAYQKKTSINE
jgi:chorismate--pyruvate lyase